MAEAKAGNRAEYGQIISIRLNKDKEEVYPEFKKLVTEELHSDVCYTLTALMEAFNSAVKNIPPPEGVTEIKFLRQNVQINIGTNFNYNVRRPRRQPPGSLPPAISLKKEHFLPLFIEEMKEGIVKPESKKFWAERFREAGLLQELNELAGLPVAKKPRRRRKRAVKKKAKRQGLKRLLKLGLKTLKRQLGSLRRD